MGRSTRNFPLMFTSSAKSSNSNHTWLVRLLIGVALITRTTHAATLIWRSYGSHVRRQLGGVRGTARVLACTLVFLILTGGTVLGATKTWPGGGPNDNTSIWAKLGGTAPVANDDLAFAGNLRLTPNQVAALAVNSLSFNSGAGAFTIGGALYTVNSGGITNNSTSTQTINNTITLSAAQTVVGSRSEKEQECAME